MCVCVCVCVCVYVCVFIKLCFVIPFNLEVRLVDAPDGVKQEGGHTGFLHLSSTVLALICIARRIRSRVSLVDREVEFCVPTTYSASTT